LQAPKIQQPSQNGKKSSFPLFQTQTLQQERAHLEKHLLKELIPNTVRRSVSEQVAIKGRLQPVNSLLAHTPEQSS
jgi:hypothetical protein